MPGPCSPERDAFEVLARAHVRPTALARDEAARFDRGLFAQLAGAGLFATAQTGDVRAAAGALAGLAHGGFDVPLGLSAAAQWIGVHLLSSLGTDDQRARFVPPLVRGEWLVAVCNSEPQAGTQLRAMRSRAVPDGDDCLLTLAKSSASNLSDADVALVSAWLGEPGPVPGPGPGPGPGPTPTPAPELEVFVLPARAPLVQETHVTSLAGFRTGLTGALRTDGPLRIERAAAQLGGAAAAGARTGARALRLCFHLERLFIGALIQGCMDALLETCAAHLSAREAHDPQFTKNQYVQDKLVALYTLARRTEGLLALAGQALAADADAPLLARLEPLSALLAVLKLTAVEDGLTAATTAYELLGYAGYQRACFVQKAHRDLLAFKLLGGSRELMKISMFRDLGGPGRPRQRPGE